MFENKTLILQKIAYFIIDEFFNKNNIRQIEKIKKVMLND